MRISIVTLALDSPQYLDDAIRSVPVRGPFELEHLIVHDGDDACRNDIERRHPQMTVIRGDGTGATSAAARGVEAATGDFILLLHSDDRLGPKALDRLVDCAAARPEVKIWTGGARIFCTAADGREQTVRLLLSRDLNEMSLANVCDDLPLLSARFCHRSVYAEIGNFNLAYSESSDREFLLRAVMAGVVEAPLDVIVSEMRFHDGSRTIHRRAGWVPPYLAEHVRLAGAWLKRPDIGTAARRFLQNWQARELLRLIVYQCRAGQWRAAAGSLRRTEIQNPLWIFRIATVLTAVKRRARGDAQVVDHVLDMNASRRDGV